MLSNGNNSLKVSTKKPLYLLDENISNKFIIPFQALGYNMTSVNDEFPKAKLREVGKKSAEDPDIINWLSSQQELQGCKSVWITDDWKAHKAHAKIILASFISVFWICDPLHNALRAIQQLQVLTMMIEHIDNIIQKSDGPKYLKGTNDNGKIKLWLLSSHLLAKKLEWKKYIANIDNK